jgi:hypothetical protein
LKRNCGILLSLILNTLLTPSCLASADVENGVKGVSSLDWNVSHGYPQSIKDKDSLEKTIPSLLAKHEFATVDKIAETLRTYKTRYPDGHSALFHFYDVMELPGTASDEVWTNRLKDLSQWQRQYPNSKTAEAALVSYWVRFAWKARGGSYSDSVTPQGWKDFAARLAKGHEILDPIMATAMRAIMSLGLGFLFEGIVLSLRDVPSLANHGWRATTCGP